MPAVAIVLTGNNPTLTQQLTRFIAQADELVAQVHDDLDLDAISLPAPSVPTVLVAPLHVPAEGDLETMRRFHSRHPHVRILAVSPLAAEGYQAAAFAAGASAILADHELVDALLPTIFRLAGLEEGEYAAE